MPEFDVIAKKYLDVWNETDPARRRELIGELFTEDVRYTDPLGSVDGQDALDGFVGGAQEQFAGLTFSLAGTVDGHHDIARFTWHLGPAGAVEPPVIGFDVVHLDGERIRSVAGFLDRMPG